jgi:hypothetical protein
VTIGIYDIAGCVVKFFRLTPDALRTAHVTWDCTDYAGQSVPAGVYFVHIPLDGQELISKVTVIK